MAFSESLRVTIRKRAHLRCCLCHSIGIDIHHIEPQSEGGLDADENAAPLCPSCHETYGANPQKRKFIREARDLWYEICATRFASDNEQLTVITEMLRNVATKDDVERLAIQNTGFVLGALARADGASQDQSTYSFEREEFVHPLIVRELLGWLSDPAATVVAVDLTSANQSNRFFGEFSRSVRDGRTWVEWIVDGRESFAYAHIATSPSGIQMVECYDRSGGTGVFGSVGLFSVECDRALEAGDAMSARTRDLLKTLGAVPLGDRYAGHIVYENGVLAIGPDEGWFQRGKDAAKTLLVR
jgi:hypothetical protein